MKDFRESGQGPLPDGMDAHGNDTRFVEYYAKASQADAANERARGIMRVVFHARRMAGLSIQALSVADIGCNAGTQAICWLEQGHTVSGADISRDLISIATLRTQDFGSRASFRVADATSLPWADNSFDVCLLPELLEHVKDWETCLREAVRVLRHRGTLYVSTTNVLCPIQSEFNLPAYSWYPRRLKEIGLPPVRRTDPSLILRHSRRPRD